MSSQAATSSAARVDSRKPPDPLGEHRAQGRVQRQRLGQRLPTGELRIREAGRQLQQRERVAGRLGQQPLTHRRHRTRCAASEQAHGRLAVQARRPSAARAQHPRTAAARPREPQTAITTPSATSRRAVNTSASTDGTSSHCASSTRHSTGPGSAAAASSDSTPADTRKRSRPSLGARPRAAANASRCGPGSLSQAIHDRPHQPMQPREREV